MTTQKKCQGALKIKRLLRKAGIRTKRRAKTGDIVIKVSAATPYFPLRPSKEWKK